MSNIPDSRVAKARFVQSLQADRAARLAAEQQARPTATDADREATTTEAFRAAFTAPPLPVPMPRPAVSAESPWDRIVAALDPDDDTPRPPEVDSLPPVAAAPEAIPASVPPEETRRRQSSAELFAALEQRLSTVPEAVKVSPEVQLRRLYRELPASQREALAKAVEQSDYGMTDYFAARNYGPDYVSVLVGHSLAKRYQDAQRLQPGLSPEALLQTMLGDPAS